MLDEFFGGLLPFRLGVIEQGHLEQQQSPPILIHFMARVADGLVKADFSVDDSGPHDYRLLTNAAMSQWSLRIRDANPLPILIENVESHLGSIIGKADSHHGSLIFDLMTVNPNAEIASCSFIVSGLPRFYHPLKFSETGPFRRFEYGRDAREESRPPPNFQIGEHTFEYVLEDATERSSCYRVFFQRIDGANMDVGEAERLIQIWAGLFAFVSGDYRYAEMVIGRDSKYAPVYGSWRNVSDHPPLDIDNWMRNSRAFDFYEFAKLFVKHFLEEGNTDLLHWFTSASNILKHSDGASVVIAYAVLERLTKNALGKSRVSTDEIKGMLQELGITNSIKNSNPLACWDYPRDEGETDEDASADDLGIFGLKAWRDKLSGHWDTGIQSVEIRCQFWYAMLALTYLELYILHRVGYQGTFSPRVSYHPQVIPVPWAQTDPAKTP